MFAASANTSAICVESLASKPKPFKALATTFEVSAILEPDASAAAIIPGIAFIV